MAPTTLYTNSEKMQLRLTSRKHKKLTANSHETSNIGFGGFRLHPIFYISSIFVEARFCFFLRLFCVQTAARISIHVVLHIFQVEERETGAYRKQRQKLYNRQTETLHARAQASPHQDPNAHFLRDAARFVWRARVFSVEPAFERRIFRGKKFLQINFFSRIKSKSSMQRKLEPTQTIHKRF